MFLFVLTPILGFITYLIANTAEKYTKINKFILYIIFGFILGASGLHIIDKEAISTPMNTYNDLIGLVGLMFLAGISLDFKLFKQLGIKLTLLAIIPVYIESFIASIIIYFSYHIITGGNLSYIYVLLIALLLAPTQLTIILPALMRRMTTKKSSPNNLEIKFFSILAIEGIASLLGFIVIASILSQIQGDANKLNLGALASNILIIIVAIIVMCLLMLGISFIIGKYTKSLALKIQTTRDAAIYYVVSLILIVVFILLSGPFEAIGFMFGMFFAIGVKFNLTDDASAKIQNVASNIFSKSTVPTIFTLIGGQIILSTLDIYSS